MALPPFLINHGEKIIVAVVAALAITVVILKINDETTKPSLSMAQITSELNTVADAERAQVTPNLMAPVDIGSRVRSRLALADTLPQPQVPAFLHEIPTLGDAMMVEVPAFAYGFVVRQPTLKLNNRIGAFELSITPPAPALPADAPRLRDGLSTTFSRQIAGKESINSVSVIGIQVEMKTKDGAWAPLKEAGNDLGFVALRGQSPVQITISDAREWQTYHFRSRLLALATGPEEVGRPTPGNEVLVFAGDAPIAAADFQNVLDARLHSNTGISDVPTAQRVPAPPLRAVVEIPPQQQVYAGPWSEEVAEQVQATTRFVLTRVAPNPQPGGPARATFQLTRMLNGKWIPPQQFVVEVGDMLGDPEHIWLNPETGLREQIDLGTPFQLVEVDMEAVRTTHYEIRIRTNMEQGTQRMLEFDARQNNRTRTAGLENTVTGGRMTLVELARYQIRPTSEFLKNFPDHPPGLVDEPKLFTEDPMSFRQPALAPPPPIARPANHPRLWQLFPDAPATEVPYLELADGRFLFVDKLNDRFIMERIIPNSIAAREAAEAKAAAEAKEAKETAQNPGPATAR